MNILIVAATLPEIEPLVRNWQVIPGEGNSFSCVDEGGNTLTVLITGIGAMRTAFYLGKALGENRYDLALNLGIAGSFSKKLAIGEVVHVTSDVLTDLGAEDGDTFLDLFDLGLEEKDEFPYTHGMLVNASQLENSVLSSLSQVRGSTVNRVLGSTDSIKETVEKYEPDIETMEGAAFFFSCLQEKVPFLQIRSISNYVEVRDRTKWDIPLGIQRLNETAISLLSVLPASGK